MASEIISDLLDSSIDYSLDEEKESSDKEDLSLNIDTEEMFERIYAENFPLDNLSETENQEFDEIIFDGSPEQATVAMFDLLYYQYWPNDE